MRSLKHSTQFKFERLVCSSTVENQQMLINSYASCRRLLDHMKQIVGIQHEGDVVCNVDGAHVEFLCLPNRNNRRDGQRWKIEGTQRALR